MNEHEMFLQQALVTMPLVSHIFSELCDIVYYKYKKLVKTFINGLQTEKYTTNT